MLRTARPRHCMQSSTYSQIDQLLLFRQLVDDLREWTSNLADISLIEPQIGIGNRIEVCDGPFMGLEATVLQEMPDQERIVILLDAIESGARVVINRSLVQRAG